MESFTADIIAITDNLKEAITELSIGLFERDNLLRLANKLDLIEQEVALLNETLDSEQEELTVLTNSLLPLKGFFVDENVNPKTNANNTTKMGTITDLNRSTQLLKQKKRPLTTTTASSNSDLTSTNLDTITPVSESEFDTLPKYLKGRLNADKVNLFIDDFNKIVADKYSILAANPAKLSVDQRQRFYDWKQSENEETRGKFFISDADLKSKSGLMGAFKFDQSARNMLTVLRQAGRIKEVRSSGTIRYVITK